MDLRTYLLDLLGLNRSATLPVAVRWEVLRLLSPLRLVRLRLRRLRLRLQLLISPLPYLRQPSRVIRQSLNFYQSFVRTRTVH